MHAVCFISRILKNRVGLNIGPCLQKLEKKVVRINYYLFMASYYRKLSKDIKMKNDKIITSFVKTRGAKRLGLQNWYDFYFNIREICLKYYDIYDCSVYLRTSSNTVDINRFRSHTGHLFPRV